MPRAASLAAAAIVSVVCALLALVLLHFLRPDLPPGSNMLSNYAVGRYGWVMTVCFLAFSLGCLSLLLALARADHHSRLAHLGTVLLGIAAAGLAVTAAFPTDLPGAPLTRSGDIHEISFFVNVGSLVPATAIISAALWSPPRWRALRRVSAALAVLIILALILQFLTLHRCRPYGLANRLFAVLLFAWMIVMAVRVRLATRQSEARTTRQALSGNE